MSNKHLSEDEIRYTVDVKTAAAQKEIYKLEQQTKKLRSENKARLNQMIQLEAAGRKESDTYKNLRKQYTETGKEIKNLTSQIGDQTSKLNVLDMTMAQLKKQQKSLQKEFENTSKSLNPEMYELLEQKLQEVNSRMSSLRQNAKSFVELANSDQVNGVFLGNVMTKGAELFGSWARGFKDSVKELVDGGLEMAETADGVTKAFNDLDNPNLLDNLRKATKGTVNDVQLMTAAVQAKDFRIPLEDLGKYLQFAQLKAQQTGQSVDYMTNSIVTGLGRKSPMILDNLGISAAEISEKTKETGDFMQAVASIVDNQLAAAGETYISAADRAAQKTVELENAQKALGDELLPIKEAWDDAYADMQLNTISLISWVVKHQGVVKALGIMLTAFTVIAIATSNAIKTNIVVTKGAAAAQQMWNVACATGTGLMKLLQAGFYLLTGRVTQAKTAWAAMNTTMKASVFGLIAAGVAVLAMKLWDMHKKQEAAAASAKELETMEKNVNQQVNEQTAKVKALNDTMRDEKISIDRRREALNELKKIIPGYNGMLSEEGRLTRDNKAAIDDYLISLEKEIKMKAYKDKLVELYKQKSDLEDQRDEQQKTYDDAHTDNILHPQNSFTRKISIAFGTDSEFNAKKALDNTNSQIDEATRKINVLNERIAAIGPVTPKKHSGGGSSNNNDTHTGTGGRTTTTTTTSTAPNPDDTASKKFAADRQAELDAENLAYQQDVNNWNMALAKKETSQEKYDLAMSALNTQHTANLLAIETSYTERSQSIDIKDAEKKKSLQDTQLKNLQAAEQKHLEQQIAAENAYQEALAKVMEQGGGQQALTLEDEYHQQLEVLNGYYNAALDLAKQNGEDITQLQAAYAEAQAKIQSDYDEKRAAKLAEEADKEKQARQSLGFDQQSEYDQQLEQLQSALDQQYITQEEYEKKVQQLKKDSFMKQAQYYTELFSNAVGALQQAEMSNVDAKYDAEIKAAEGNTELQEKLEKKKANEKLKIQKKYADVNFAMQAAQIVANTATSIMKAYSDMGPVAGSIAAALMGVTGAAQLVVANAERQKVKRMTLSNTGCSSSGGSRVASGRESGGRIDVEREQDGKHFNAEYDPKKRGYVNHPTVIVGEGPAGRSKEWVASNAALQNPTVAPLINILDAAQRAGNIRTFDLGKYLMAMQGRQLGGSIQSNAASGQSYQTLHKSDASPMQGRYEPDAATMELMTEMASLLRDLKNNGIPATVALTELDAKQKLREQSRGFAKK